MFGNMDSIGNLNEDFRNRDFSAEFIFSASRSSGPGGQNVNKVNSKIELRFPVIQTSLLSDAEKQTILDKLKKKINSAGELIITVQTGRSQLTNKEEAIEKFYDLLTKALTPRKKRKSTVPTPESIEKRLEQKRKTGEKKILRKMLD
jgi:ribosome-associated protein